MSKCGKCNMDLNKKEVSATCSECTKMFHSACTQSGSEQNFTKLKSKTWKCKTCHENEFSPSSVKTSEDDKRWLLEVLNQMKNEINQNIDNKIDSLKDQITAFTEQLAEINSKVSDLESGQHDLQKQCEKLQQENYHLSKEVTEIKEKFLDAEQHSRCSNIEIVGLPASENEDIYACLEQTAKVINVPFKKSDISIAHRLRLYSRKHRHPPIIVQFVNRGTKETWLQAARMKRNINATEVAAGLQPSNVYINHHLTGHNKAILGRARGLCRNKKIHFAGFFNGKVLIKPKEGDRSIRVTMLEQLDDYDLP